MSTTSGETGTVRGRSGRGAGSVLTAAAVLALAACAVTPARADDCAVIYKAFEALAGAPSYSQDVTVQGNRLRSVVIGDVMYVNSGSDWQKIPLTAEGRRGILKQFLPDGTYLKECAKVGSETIGGKAMTVYSYVPPVPKGMEAFADAAGPQKLWVGVADGLPYRMTASSVDMSISFDGVTAPIP
ncbi:hypothetical protein [Ancylobacter terrae]|uniref:hypothetical protein n=1 Tax=Ancylobacter sp. sgz301288 TaxID=3342077 RepID=UPI003857F729